MKAYCQYCGIDSPIPCCPECEPKRQANREARWLKLCPPAFHETEIEKLPHPALARKALDHSFEDGTGLVLFGASGGGKTRVAWLLVRRAINEGMSVQLLTSLSAVEYGAEFSKGMPAVQRWILRHLECDLLVLDDVFKNKLTEAFEAVVFALIDKRAENKMPILVTINGLAKNLTARMSEDRGEPLVRRLREFCEAIHFGVKT